MAQQLVLAFFGNEAAADNAVEAIKQWDKADKDVKLGGIGVLVKDDKGKIKTDKLGRAPHQGGRCPVWLSRPPDRRHGDRSRRGGWRRRRRHYRRLVPQRAEDV